VVAAGPTAMRVRAVILAAGRGARVGGPKALLTLEGETFLARVARLLRRPGVERVTAVLGRSGSVVTTAAATSCGARLVSRYGERPVSSSYSTTPSE